MTNIFDGEKYKEASLKAIEFIKRQLNVNNYSLFPKLAEDYDSGYTGRIIAKVDLPEPFGPSATYTFPRLITNPAGLANVTPMYWSVGLTADNRMLISLR